MSIQQPYMTVGSTSTRANTKTVVLAIAGAIPPETYRVPSGDGTSVEVSQFPVTEGAVVAHRQEGSSDVQLYVTVLVNNVPIWKPVIMIAEIVDPYTGKPFDPLARFYDPLAS